VQGGGGVSKPHATPQDIHTALKMLWRAQKAQDWELASYVSIMLEEWLQLHAEQWKELLSIAESLSFGIADARWDGDSDGRDAIIGAESDLEWWIKDSTRPEKKPKS
jgi:hypothetical protein